MNLLGSILDWPIGLVASLALFALFAYILIQILVQFEIIPRHNQASRQLWAQLHRIFNPILTPIRNVLPSLGGFDLSPLVLVFGIIITRNILQYLL